MVESDITTNQVYLRRKQDSVLFDFTEDGQKEVLVIYVTNMMNKRGKLK